MVYLVSNAASGTAVAQPFADLDSELLIGLLQNCSANQLRQAMNDTLGNSTAKMSVELLMQAATYVHQEANPQDPPAGSVASRTNALVCKESKTSATLLKSNSSVAPAVATMPTLQPLGNVAPRTNTLETIVPAQPKSTLAQLQPSAAVDMQMFTNALSKELELRQQAGAGVQVQLRSDLSATSDSSKSEGMLSKILTSEGGIDSKNNKTFATPSEQVAKEQSEPGHLQQQALQQPRYSRCNHALKNTVPVSVAQVQCGAVECIQ